MKKEIKVIVKDKIAIAEKNAMYICGNSDFVINFEFDSEWDEFSTKTARFVFGGRHIDVIFQGNQCAVPIITNTYNFKVGVFAGNLRTTTSAYISAMKSVLCDSGSPAQPSNDVYNQLMEMLNDLVSRIEKLEQGGIIVPDTTSAILGTARLDSMVLA